MGIIPAGHDPGVPVRDAPTQGTQRPASVRWQGLRFGVPHEGVVSGCELICSIAALPSFVSIPLRCSAPRSRAQTGGTNHAVVSCADIDGRIVPALREVVCNEEVEQ